MKHLVVLAHPRSGSFTHQVCEQWCGTLRELGHQVVLRDLYAMNFNPVAAAEEAYTRPTAPPPPDVQVEMDHLVAADAVHFIAPVWWISAPAILKGWLDRVLRGGGFAYGYGPDGPSGTLRDKTSVVFTSSGSTVQEFLDSRKMDAIRVMWKEGTVEFCGMRLLEHVHFGPVGSRTRPEAIQDHLRSVRDAALRHYAGR